MDTTHAFNIAAAANKQERDTAIAEAAAAGVARDEIAAHAGVSLSSVARAIKWYADNPPAPDMSEEFAAEEEAAEAAEAAAEEQPAKTHNVGSLDALVEAAKGGAGPVRDTAIMDSINAGYTRNEVAKAAGISTIRLGQIIRASVTPRLNDYQTGYQSALADILVALESGGAERAAEWINDNRMEAAEGIYTRRAAEEV